MRFLNRLLPSTRSSPMKQETMADFSSFATDEELASPPSSPTSSPAPYPDPGPPPDGGAAAWFQAALGHLMVFNTWGYINSFGVFQTYYIQTLNHPPSDISWVGSVQIFLLFFIGTFSGRLTDAGYFRITFFIGSVCQVLGIFMTSLSTKYWQLFLAQGLLTGIGNGLVFCPSLTLLSTYFTTNRSIAIAIAAAGSSTGGLVFPAIVRQLLPKIGFAWTVRVLGFVILALCTITNLFCKTRLPPRKAGPVVEWSAFKEPAYTLFAVGMFFSFWGLYFAFYYIGAYGRIVLGLSQGDSITLLMILNGLGVVGRLFPNFIADKFFGPLNVLIPWTFISALMVFCWIAIDTKAGLLAFAVVFGIFGGGIQSLFPATAASLTTDLSKAGTRIGMVFSIVAFACLTGPPIAGALIERDNGGYLYAQIFSGMTFVVGGSTLIAARVSRTGWTWKHRM